MGKERHAAFDFWIKQGLVKRHANALPNRGYSTLEDLQAFLAAANSAASCSIASSSARNAELVGGIGRCLQGPRSPVQRRAPALELGEVGLRT